MPVKTMLWPVIVWGTVASASELSLPQSLTDPAAPGHSRWFDTVTDNLRLTLDISSRVSIDTLRGKPSAVHAVGFDLHKVFSSPEGDFGTAVLQGYATRLDNVQRRPPFFDDDDDCQFVFRIFNYNHVVVTRGRLNVRVGHFEIPYGLEHLINTNGTLRNYIHGRNLGVKADWGVGINGVLSELEYEVGLSRGTGNEFFDRGNPFIIAGRIGTSRDRNAIFGLSVMHGRVWDPGAAARWTAGFTDPREDYDRRAVFGVLRRDRVGVDMQFYDGPWGVLVEASYGRDYNQDVANGVLELNWEDQAGRWLAYGQALVFGQRFDIGWEEAIHGVFGLRYAPDSHWSYSFQYTQQVETFLDAPRGAQFSLQVRYRL